jgi:hypothetical protein
MLLQIVTALTAAAQRTGGVERNPSFKCISPFKSLKTARYGANICASTASAGATSIRVILFSNRDLSTARS